MRAREAARLFVLGRRVVAGDRVVTEIPVASDDVDACFAALVEGLAARFGRRRVGGLALLGAALWLEHGRPLQRGPHLRIWGPAHRSWVEAGLDDDLILHKLRALLRPN